MLIVRGMQRCSSRSPAGGRRRLTSAWPVWWVLSSGFGGAGSARAFGPISRHIRGAAVVTRHEPLYSVSVQGLLFTYPLSAAVLHRPVELLGEAGAVGH